MGKLDEVKGEFIFRLHIYTLGLPVGSDDYANKIRYVEIQTNSRTGVARWTAGQHVK